VALQGAGEVVAGELAALVGIEDLGLAVQRERLFEGLDTELRADGQSLWRRIRRAIVELQAPPVGPLH